MNSLSWSALAVAAALSTGVNVAFAHDEEVLAAVVREELIEGEGMPANVIVRRVRHEDSLLCGEYAVPKPDQQFVEYHAFFAAYLGPGANAWQPGQPVGVTITMMDKPSVDDARKGCRALKLDVG